jgi:[protein-PII] uridylyltransferase
MDPAARAPLPPLPRLPAAVPRSGVSAEARLALRQLLADDARDLAASFDHGTDATALAARRARLIEQVVAHVWTACLGEPASLALYAVGGFGRGLLFPCSDVDLLALAGDAVAPHARGIEALIACLWDIGLKPGHALRDPAQCRALAAADVSVYSSLLDARRIAGDAGLDAALQALRDDPALWPPATFLAAKRAEQADRHARRGDTVQNLEPDLKEGPGGLRTLDLMRWLGARLACAPDFPAMIAAGLLDPAEGAALEAAEAVLRRDRTALHLAAGRAEERLLFDHQRALAERLGFREEHAGNLAVEQFMQAYYRAAGSIERLGAQIIERMDERLHPLPPAQSLDAEFQCRGTRIEPRDPALFERDPSALVRLFAVAIEHKAIDGCSAHAMRAVQRALATHGAALPAHAGALAAFRTLLGRGAAAVPALIEMNRQRVLGALLPAFARVAGRMQYDLFHVYTVDEHTLRVLRHLARFADPGARGEFPLACERYARLERADLLLLAALFHDIAKGRGGDHSELGADEARAFGARLGLHVSEIERVAWLVRHHLLLSITAQRQDIGDPEVVRRFAAQVGNSERLDELYLLTVADIIGTSPKLWNAWKDRLLADLYLAARDRLRGEESAPVDDGAGTRAAQARARTMLAAAGATDAAVADVWAQWPAASFLRQRPEQIAWQTQALLHAGGSLPVVAVLPHSVRGASEAFVCAPDRDGLFAAITATFERLRFGVQEARVLGTRDGLALDSFLLLDSDTQAAATPERAEELRRRLLGALADPQRVRAPRHAPQRRLRHFQRTPRIEFNATADGRTQLALVCTDRPGLLADIAQAFRVARVRVHDARIATFGERAEDFFELTDAADRALDAARQRALRAALHERLDPSVVPSPDHAHD